MNKRRYLGEVLSESSTLYTVSCRELCDRFFIVSKRDSRGRAFVWFKFYKSKRSECCGYVVKDK